jgi:hypothetical protein
VTTQSAPVAEVAARLPELPPVTPESLAARRLAALDKLAQAQRLADQADTELILADLAEAEPTVRAEAERATAAREQAEPVVEAGKAKLAALRERLAVLEQRLAAARRAADTSALDDDAYLATDMDAVLAARAEVAAVEAEAAEVRRRIGAVGNVLSGPVGALRDAWRDEDAATGHYQALLAAALDPLNHDRAARTPAYRFRVARDLAAVLSLPGHPDAALAREVLRELLAVSGVGAEVEERAIRAYVSGQVDARAIGGGTKHFADGTTLVSEPGRPPAVLHGGATPQQLAAAPGHAQVDTRGAADVMASSWAGVVHRTHLGVPMLGG